MADNPVPIQRRSGALTSPLESWASLRSDFDRLFDQLTSNLGSRAPCRPWTSLKTISPTR